MMYDSIGTCRIDCFVSFFLLKVVIYLICHDTTRVYMIIFSVLCIFDSSTTFHLLYAYSSLFVLVQAFVRPVHSAFCFSAAAIIQPVMYVNLCFCCPLALCVFFCFKNRSVLNASWRQSD